ncbi:N-formylglutamate amidohydrolase [Chelatococcus reniformis]|uniref:N-formylglutamate amidohydrolase n=1 Tax=Chelatococcus reniformis TaxID=1494448 RepID=A0A916UG75_9HYPH|nr:N-formylglutamate amidohydrolase [Chelatococcus reniformis]GGC71325.1 N-formylglutamate amidohydrolase [Chelatococcus reniformis]
MIERLLAADEPAPVTVRNPDGRSPLLLVADHAGNRFPRALGRLGVPEHEWERHIGWDIGIAGVCHLMADALDATLIQQNYSRLIVDCNRPPEALTSMPAISESTPIPGNASIDERARAARVCEIFHPYHNRIAAELDARQRADRPTTLIAMHSFTPVFKGTPRPWHVGLLYNRDRRLAGPLLALLERETGLVVGDNEPYSVSDTTDYTVPVHGERRGLPHIAIEIRQDLIADGDGQRLWAARFARLLTRAADEMTAAPAAAALAP